MQQRIAAAQATATNSSASSSCGAISQQPSGSDDGFYWEIGDASGIISDPSSGLTAAGSVQPAGTSGTNYLRSTEMLIASASKWMYGSYVAETQAVLQDGTWTIPAADVPFLNFTSGYDKMTDQCPASTTPTVQDCLDTLDTSGVANGTQTPGDVGRFYYNSGHLEVFEGGADPSIAGVMNGANDDDAMLTSMIETAFAAKSVNVNLVFVTPILAGGIATTPGNYAAFLQGLIATGNPLVMSNFLNPTASDPYAVCTNPFASGCNAVYAPLPASISWHYSITHWIEDDPSTGDGSYSSPGKFGFYPWIDSTKTYYGIVARYDDNPTTVAQSAPYYMSAICGANIRKAFMTGQAQD